MAKLSPREKEAMNLLGKGLFYKEVANFMGITLGNLKQKVHKIYNKLGVDNRTEALNKLKSMDKDKT